MSKEDTPTCEGCGTPLTIKHILTECQLYQQERINFAITETLDSLLGPDSAQNRKILNFLKSIPGCKINRSIKQKKEYNMKYTNIPKYN